MLKRQLISIVSAVLLAAHVSVGCCAHHEHARDGRACITFAAPHDHHHGDAARHDHDHGHAAHHGECDHSAPQHDHQPGDHHCGEGHCSFLAACRVGVPELASDYAIVPPNAVMLLAQVGPQAVAQSALPDDSPPVRPHLVKQVLLI